MEKAKVTFVAGQALLLSIAVSAASAHAREGRRPEKEPSSRPSAAGAGYEKALLGSFLFNDPALSASGTQSCASCHEMNRAFSGNNEPEDPLFPVSTGAFPELLGGRNTPTAMYMAFSPPFAFVEDEGEYIPLGGQFWDGRAATLAEQAKQPFLNPREMALPSEAAVVERVARAHYAPLFESVYGPGAFRDVHRAYEDMVDAIAAFESTPAFAPFSSKFDAVLRGEAHLSRTEQRGFELFKDPEKGNCIGCHVGEESSSDPRDWLFTDFTYDNLGVPRNDLIPDNADPSFFDLGVCAQSGIEQKVPRAAGDAEALVESLCGAFKVPTLRNVAVTAPYFHNGVLQSLRDVVSFYATRDTHPERWYPVTRRGRVKKFDDLPPRYHGNVNTGEAPYDRGPGEQPRLSPGEIEAVVAFLRTLTDGYRAQPQEEGAPRRHRH